jgi:eukaryotic-like serine/threonine-protein kinase
MSNEHLKLVPAAPTEPPDPLIGQVLDGRYRIERVLGEGGMGIVYKAQHVALNKPLAIKVLRAEVSKDQEIVQRFRQEAQSATAIGNHHIIDISDFGVLPDGSTYFVMEFLDGIPLARAIEPGKPLKASRTIHIAKQLCRALGAAHDVGIVHRDLKPDNIYLINRGGDRDFVKVLDFGIAKVGGQKSKLTQVGQVFGTPHYMSPEQCAGTAVDRRTDVYALGVIMYEMTSSRVPFDADNLMGILTKHLYEEPVMPRDLPPPVDVPAALESVIMKSLAKKADVRYQSMQEVLEDLERVEQGVTPEAVMDGMKRATAPGPVTAGTLPRGSALTMDVGDVQLPKRSSAGLIVGSVVAVLLAGGAALLMRSKDPEPTQPIVAEPTPPAKTPDAPTEQQPVAGNSDPSDTPRSDVPQPPEPEPVVQVQISTTPRDTDVFANGGLIGSTGAAPFVVERPKAGAGALVLTFKAEGYKDFELPISGLTQPKLTIELEREKRRGGSSGGGSSRPSGTRPEATKPPLPSQPEPKPPAEEPKPKPKPRTPSDVLDPWG